MQTLACFLTQLELCRPLLASSICWSFADPCLLPCSSGAMQTLACFKFLAPPELCRPLIASSICRCFAVPCLLSHSAGAMQTLASFLAP
eukprot:1200523-Rhodomonas_salina.2